MARCVEGGGISVKHGVMQAATALWHDRYVQRKMLLSKIPRRMAQIVCSASNSARLSQRCHL
jgi:hypothetical protein